MGVILASRLIGLTRARLTPRATEAGYTAAGTDNNLGAAPAEHGHGFQGRF